MGVVLFILKIIGIILLVILGIIVILLISPLMYKGRLQMTEESGFEMKARIHYLFGIIFVGFSVDDNGTDGAVRIFGIKIMSLFKSDDEKSEDKDKKKEEEDTDKKDKESDKKDEETDEIDEELFELIEESEKSTEEDSEENQKKSKSKGNIFDRIRDRIVSTLEKIRDALRKGIDSITETKKNITELWRVFRSATSKRAMKALKKLIVKLLKDILPRHLEGSVEFGFDEPHVTGQAVAGLAMAYPALGIDRKRFQAYPNFVEKKLDADCMFKGHFFLGHMLLLVIRFLLNRDVMKLIRYFMKKSKKDKEKHKDKKDNKEAKK